ncbi:hypothetical protein V6N13_009684 [Hibiscus sabdariffa]
MSASISHFSPPFSESSIASPISVFPGAANNFQLSGGSRLVLHGGAGSFCWRFRGLKLRILKRLNRWQHVPANELKGIRNQDKVLSDNPSSNDEQYSEAASTISLSNGLAEEHTRKTSQPKTSTLPPVTTFSLNLNVDDNHGRPSLCIAVIGATGELAKKKIFPALFALYYSGFLPENVGIFGYSRKDLTDEELRSLIASTLTCRIDHQYGPRSYYNMPPLEIIVFNS